MPGHSAAMMRGRPLERDEECCDCWMQSICFPCFLYHLLLPGSKTPVSLARTQWEVTKDDSMSLCWVCAKYLHLTGGDHNRYWGHSLYSKTEWRRTHPFGTLSDFEKRAKVCACCTMVLRLFKVCPPGSCIKLAKADFGYWIWEDAWEGTDHNPIQLARKEVKAPLYVTSKEPMMEFPYTSRIHQVSKSSINMTVCRSWYVDCEDAHGQACHARTSAKIPSHVRVIDVRERCIVFPAPDHCSFAALSYVWGGVERTKLPNPNVPRYELGDFYNSLPQTLKDSIEVTKQMGLQYIWIDALCIQDCDQASEVAQFADMASIYGNAMFTIVAAQGRSANDGLHRLRASHTSHADTNALNIDDNIAFVEGLELPDDIRRSPWVTRAWCLQEQLLSQRFLVFWDNQVYWQCKKSIQFEDMPVGLKPEILRAPKDEVEYWKDRGRAHAPIVRKYDSLPSDAAVHQPFKVSKLGVNLGTEEIDATSRDHIQTLGHDTILVRTPLFSDYASIVDLYTSRSLTKDTDALNAVEGLLQLVSTGLDTKMLYGLPECLLDVALLWYPSERLRRRCSDSIPSWSWAGWSGNIAYQPTVEFQDKGRRLVPTREVHKERIRPLVQWWRADERGTKVLVNGTGDGVRAAEKLKAGVRIHGCSSPSSNALDTHRISPMTLQLWTMCLPNLMAHTEGNGILYDANSGHTPASELFPDTTPNLQKLPPNTALIVVSEAQLFNSEDMNERYDLYNHQRQYHLYNVLMVSLASDGCHATRVGIGKVLKRAWHDYFGEEGWRMVCLE